MHSAGEFTIMNRMMSRIKYPGALELDLYKHIETNLVADFYPAGSGNLFFIVVE